MVSELRELEQKENELRYTLSRIDELEEEAARQTKKAKKLQEGLEEYYQTDVELYELLLEKRAELQKKEKLETEAFSAIRKELRNSLEEGEKQRKLLKDRKNQEEE